MKGHQGRNSGRIGTDTETMEGCKLLAYLACFFFFFYNIQYYQPRSGIVHSQLGLPNPENEQVSQEAI